MTDTSPHDAACRAELAPPAEPSPDCSLDRLTRDLTRLLVGGAGQQHGAEVAALLRDYAGCEESWRRYANFCDETYSRNLVWRNGDYELLLLCWNEGQESPIHDHAGQHCWMAVLDGELEEVHFNLDDEGVLQAGRVKAFPKGGVAFIEDDIALHLIRPKHGTRGVSLHLYSNPIDSCHVFCPETGEKTEVHVGYHSVRGAECQRDEAGRIREAWAGSEG